MLAVGGLLAGRYRIEEAVKSGGMGSVFRAYDERLEGWCAVKEMHPSPDEWAVRRFREEAKTLSRLQHPGIPKVRDFFIHDDLHYLVMDYVAGHNLSEEIGSLGPEQARRDLLELLSILEYLHELDPAIVHRDIKPSNLIRSAEDGRLILVDFGLARGLSEETQTTAGTVMFCAPEQLVGKATTRSDLYSLAATYYVLLSGREVQMGSSKPILFHCPRLAPEVAEVLDRGLQLDPEHRFPSAREMRQALLAPVAPARRPRWGLLVPALGLCLWGWWGMRPAPVPLISASATPGAAIPQLVFGQERTFWGRRIEKGQQAEAVLAEVTGEADSQGLSGRPVLVYDSQQQVSQVGILLPEGAPAPSGLAALRLPDGTSAWLVVTGDYQQLPARREQLRRWITEQGYRPGQHFYEVRRIGENNQRDSSRWETDLCWSAER
jgi:hypothetical protein